MKKGYLLAAVIVIFVLLLVLPGCNTGDIWGSLTEAQSYIAVVGIKMQAKGWDFPTTPVTWVQYIKDLKASITEAKGLGVYATGTVRGIERDVLAIPEPDMKKLNEAFKSNPAW